MIQKDNIAVNLPLKDRSRSSYAQLVTEYSLQKGLGFFHYEMRKQLPEPDPWDLGAAGDYRWQKGFLHEGKYSAFQTDLLLASFQPAHRSQWTSHELMHNLVGFAWKEGASPFFYALASRLSELLPVALFYFFDEFDANKCERHRFSAALMSENCSDCESIEGYGNIERPEALVLAKKFIDLELGAIKRSIKSKLMYENVFCGLNLTTDAMQYAKMQYPRLRDPVFSNLINNYYKRLGLVHSDLDSLVSRVELVAEALFDKNLSKLDEVKLPHANEAKALDLASRFSLMQKHVENTELADLIDKITEKNFNQYLNSNFVPCIQEYKSLEESFEMIPSEHMFSTGYRLTEDFGFCTEQVVDGLNSCMPLSMEKLFNSSEEKFRLLIQNFSRSMPCKRENIAQRFLEFTKLQEMDPGIRSTLEKEAVLCQHYSEDKSPYYLSVDLSNLKTRKLRWNTNCKSLIFSAQELKEFGIFEGEESINYNVLVLVSDKEVNPLFPLEEKEFEQIDLCLNEKTELAPEYQTLLIELYSNHFIVNQNAEL